MMFRRFVSLTLACAFLAGTAVALAAPPAQETCPPEPDPLSHELMQNAQQQATDRGFLWRISRDGRESFLYGSMHAGRSEWFALGPLVEASLSRAGVLALEIDLTDPAVLDALRSAMQGPARPLPSALMQSLRLAWAAECLPEAALAQGAVELHVMQLAVAQAQRQGLFTLYGGESLLLMHSMSAQRPVVGLESVQTQLSALMARDDSEAATMVSEMLAELQRPRAARSLERLAQAWAIRDLKDLEAYAEWCDCLNTPTEREMYARLLDGRNPGLAESIERLHAEESVFAAVGALHMVGPQGLPSLLKARGFVVTRML
ncbi:TraB/GumN family protein [Hydrogenophaga sp.]|uniref:TraB/GumN family protein n=1 Tax=Hydrogenophaga sp. TaxID=1904254 RepID=UPI002727DEBD|nr:TraB/GumN family protein [Hydrogenophaga sp.]MDO8905872.1 TraB/GumN family protein [Hydrogenophaga sp.]